MVLKLRLSRVASPTGARRHSPVYNLVLAQARSARDSLPLEVLGTYNPVPRLPLGFAEGDREVREGSVRKQKEIKVDVERARYWLGVGAQPSDTVWRILSMVRATEPTPPPSSLPILPFCAWGRALCPLPSPCSPIFSFGKNSLA